MVVPLKTLKTMGFGIAGFSFFKEKKRPSIQCSWNPVVVWSFILGQKGPTHVKQRTWKHLKRGSLQ